MTCSIRQPEHASEPFVLVPYGADAGSRCGSTSIARKRTRPSRTRSFAFQGWGRTPGSPPSRQGRGSPVHTYPVASTPECACMESIAPRDSAVAARRFRASLRVAVLSAWLRSRCVTHWHSSVLPLSYPAATRCLHGQELIDSLPACYPETRPWAEAPAYQQEPKARGHRLRLTS